MFISLAAVMGNAKIQELVSPMFENPQNHTYLTKLLIETQGRVDSANYQKLFAPILERMAKNPKADREQLYRLGLILNAQSLSSHAVDLLSKEKSAANIKAVLPILMLNAKKNMEHIKALAEDKSLSHSSRVEAMSAFLRANPKAAQSLVVSFFKGMTDTEKKSAVDRLSLSTQGTASLIKLLDQKVISEDDFNFIAATRVSEAARKNGTAKKLMKTWLARKQDEDVKRAQRVEKIFKKSTQLKGNSEVGHGLFQMCLECHAVGDRGYSIAPALDGSASRETHALLTALLRPDVATEGGYELHRITRKNGTMVEGYLYSSNDIGVTIATMGNQKVFIPRKEVRREAGVRGKSFMPALLDGMPEQNIIDLLTYIKTVK